MDTHARTRRECVYTLRNLCEGFGNRSLKGREEAARADVGLVYGNHATVQHTDLAYGSDDQMLGTSTQMGHKTEKWR